MELQTSEPYLRAREDLEADLNESSVEARARQRSDPGQPSQLHCGQILPDPTGPLMISKSNQ